MADVISEFLEFRRQAVEQLVGLGVPLEEISIDVTTYEKAYIVHKVGGTAIKLDIVAEPDGASFSAVEETDPDVLLKLGCQGKK